MSAASTAQVAAFNMDNGVRRLSGLAASLQDARSLPRSADADPIGSHLFRIDAIPDPTPEWDAAHDALRSFADELAGIGGMSLMVEVFDETVERHGYRAVAGVSGVWNGSHGWWH